MLTSYKLTGGTIKIKCPLKRCEAKMKFSKFTALLLVLSVLWNLNRAYGKVISNVISSTVVVNHSPGDIMLKTLLFNDKNMSKDTRYFREAAIQGFEAIVDLRNSRANSIRRLKLLSSSVSGIKAILPEYGIIDIGRVESQSYRDLSKDICQLPDIAAIDAEGDGFDLITMEELASKDGDGDNSVLTISCAFYDLYDSNKSTVSTMDIKILLPDVAAAWGDNSHIIEAEKVEYNYNNSGRLFVKNPPKGLETTLNIVARSNRVMSHVKYVIVHEYLEGTDYKEDVVAVSSDTSIQPGEYVNISIPVKFTVHGEYWLKVYPVVALPDTAHLRLEGKC